jgi:CheY-like chemotaxis protein
LSSRDYTAEAAADGADALSMLRTFTPDVIVLDIVMPHWSGMEVLNILKNND